MNMNAAVKFGFSSVDGKGIVKSSLVNDGICDCCDGSDEFPGVCQPNCKQERIQWDLKRKKRDLMEEQAYKKLTSKPIIADRTNHLEGLLDDFCISDSSDEIEEKFDLLKKRYKEYKEALKEEKRALYAFGYLNRFLFSWLKPTTITLSITKTANLHHTGSRDRRRYGIKEVGEWVGLLAIQDECFKWDNSEGTHFEICWFKSITRDNIPIGKFPDTLKHARRVEGHLEIELGSGGYCWKGGQKKTILKVYCGEGNLIQRVIETAPCNYQANFVTPAVC